MLLSSQLLRRLAQSNLFWENDHQGQNKNWTSLVKNKKAGQKDVLGDQKSFSPKICVHWIKVVDQKSLNERYGPFIIIWRMSQLNVCSGIIWLCLHLYSFKVLTARHCGGPKYYNFTVVAGEHNWTKEEGTEQLRTYKIWLQDHPGWG